MSEEKEREVEKIGLKKLNDEAKEEAESFANFLIEAEDKAMEE